MYVHVLVVCPEINGITPLDHVVVHCIWGEGGRGGGGGGVGGGGGGAFAPS